VPKRWQYQVKGHPTDTKTDQWIPRQPDVYFVKPSISRAIQAGSFFVGNGAPPTDNDQYPPRLPDIYFPRRELPRSIYAGSFSIGEIYKSDKDNWRRSHYPDYFPKPSLSRAIQAGSFFVGSGAPPTDKDDWDRSIYPDQFPRLVLSRAIQSGSFSVGEIRERDRDVHYPTFADYLFVKPSLSRAIQAGAFIWEAVGAGTEPTPPVSVIIMSSKGKLLKKVTDKFYIQL
jgi:hypothetical protein